MQYDLAALARRARNPRRKSITFRDMPPPAVLATNLYQSAYKPIVDLWNGQGERIAAEYERTLSALTTDAPADLQGLLDEGEGSFQRLLIELTAALRSWVLRAETWQRGKWRGAVLSATGVDLGTLLGPEDLRQTLDEYIAWNTSLVKDVSAQARKRIGDAVFSGLTQRKPAREVAADIRGAVAMSRKRSIAIASDQLSKTTSALADERRRQAGLSTWEWIHSKKLHPRTTHKARDGHIYSEDSARVGTEVDGKTVEAPPPADDLPGRQPYCGCRSRGVLLFD